MNALDQSTVSATQANLTDQQGATGAKNASNRSQHNRLRLSQLTLGIAAALVSISGPTQATPASGTIGLSPAAQVAAKPATQNSNQAVGQISAPAKTAPAVKTNNAPMPNGAVQTASLTTPQTNPANGPSSGSAAAAKVDRSNEALGCLIEPSVVVEVGSPVSGLIDRVVVERGDIIRKGQTVASLDARVERASMALASTRLRNEAEMRSAESSLDFAKRKHDRNESLHRDGIVSAQIREQAEAEAKMADQRVNQAREQRSVAAQEVELSKAQLALRTISSPVSGVVIERYLSAGERVDEKPILKVAQIHPLRVEAILPASMYGKIKTGMTMMVSPELPGAKPRAAPVTIVDRVIDPASNSFRVRMEMPNADFSLPSGVRCKVQAN
jgi:RND family efflux transporter MFP subunit